MASPFLLFFPGFNLFPCALVSKPCLHVQLHFQTIGTLVEGEHLWAGFLISIVGIGLGWWQYSQRASGETNEAYGDAGNTVDDEKGALSLNNSTVLRPQPSATVGIDALKQLLEGLPHGAILMDVGCRIILANPQAISVLRLTTAQLQGQECFSKNVQWVYPNGECCPLQDHPVQHVSQTGQPVRNITLGLRYGQAQDPRTGLGAGNADIHWVWVSAQPQLSFEGKVTHIVCTLQDITQQQTHQFTQSAIQQRQRYFFEHTPVAMIEWDAEFKVMEWNKAATSIFGYSKHEALGHHVTELIVPSMHVAMINELWHRLLTTKETSHNAHENITQSGDRILCEWYHTPLQNDSGDVVGIMSMAQDITEKQEIEQRLIYNAFHDSLTGLPNRSLFMRKLEAAVKKYRTQPSDKTCGVFFVDLDGFKFINDSLGHSIGDSLLVEVAARLEQCIRSSDLIARLGGDEFAILLDQMKSPEAVMIIAERMRKDLTRPFNLHGHEVFTGVSIGIALMQPDIVNGEVLLRNADTAMYRAKEAGKSCYRVFTPDMYAKAVSRLEMESDLRKALERDEFELHYQPILSLRSRLLFGFEALVRWRHPEKGLISPGEFIPIAEETGFIKSLGQWVLEEACRQTCLWHSQFPAKSPLIISVNLSAKQFAQPNLSAKIRQTLEDTQLPPQCLKLEITESVLMGHANSATAMIDELKELGVKFAIDDFGTGYSSLGYLHRFSVDTLKIDRSFIRSLDTDVEKIELVRTILSLAWNLGMDVVAEGIETKKHLAQLRLLKCDYGQGYFFAKPMPQDQATALLNKIWSGEHLQLLDAIAAP